jgi:(E)-4-hydroxy-3-methylbut-2-enyl-diphosphate synthase
VPLIGDFHYNGHRLLTDHPGCAEALAKYRINPGNVGFGKKKDEQFAQMIELACKYDKPVRIGVNWGSLDQDLLARIMDENSRKAEPLDATSNHAHAMVTSALESAPRRKRSGWLARRSSCLQGFQRAGSDRHLPRACQSAPITPAPRLDRGRHGFQGHRRVDRGTLRAAAGRHWRHHPYFADAGARWFAHAGSHCRPGNPADHGAAGLHADGAACPGCGRTTSTFFQELAGEVQDFVRAKMPEWKLHYDGAENMTLAVMGCIVNGPGESSTPISAFPAGHRRSTVGAGFRGWRQDGHAARRQHRQ